MTASPQTSVPKAAASCAIRVALATAAASMIPAASQPTSLQSAYVSCRVVSPEYGVYSVQFSDAAAVPEHDLATDSRNCRHMPGDGQLPLEEFVAAVRATGFDGTVAAEVLSEGVRHDDPVTVASRMNDDLARYWLCEV